MSVRPMTDADVEAAAWLMMRSIGPVMDPDYADPDPDTMAPRYARVRHCLETDPDGSWVTDDEAGLTGVALGLRRGPLWVLSLLAVRTDVQARGLGGALITAAHGVADPDGPGLIMASSDPKALRRYHSLGFTLEPALRAQGVLDRALLTADPQVRDGDWARDRDLVEELATQQRGVSHARDLDYLAEGRVLQVLDEGAERGFVLSHNGLVNLVAASTPTAAARVLRAGLATAQPGGAAEVQWMTARTPWAVDVAMELRLPLSLPGAVCRRGPLGPMTEYLPIGSLG